MKQLIDLLRNYSLSEFTSTGFMIYSNLFKGYNFEANLIHLNGINKKKKVPKFFKNFFNPDNFKIEIKGRIFKFKTEGTKHKIKYTLMSYKCIFINDQTKYFYILLMKFSDLSFFYLALPKTMKISDLINIQVKLPYYYSSKVPITKSVLMHITSYSNTIMQHKERLPYLFNYSKIFTFKESTEQNLVDFDEEVKRLYKIGKFQERESFKDYQELFTSPILRKAKNNFNNLYQTQDTIFTIPDRHKTVRFGFHLDQIDRDFFYYLVKYFFHLNDHFHMEVQDALFLFKFIQFLDWLKGNLNHLTFDEVGKLRLNLLDVLSNLEINYNAEFELNNHLQKSITPDIMDERDDYEGDFLSKHFIIHRIAILELTKFIDFLDQTKDRITLFNDERKLIGNILDRIEDANGMYRTIFKTDEKFFNDTSGIISDIVKPITHENFPNKIGSLKLLLETSTEPIENILKKFDIKKRGQTITLIKEWFDQENIYYKTSLFQTWRTIVALRNSMVPFHPQSKKMFSYLKYFNINSLDNLEENWRKIQGKFLESLQQFVFALELKVFS